MRKTFVILVCLCLVGGMAFSATPSFSGSFTTEYTLTFDEDGYQGVGAGQSTNEKAAKMNLKLQVGDYIALTFREFAAANATILATADINIGNILKEAGNPVPFSLTAHVGNQWISGLYAYSDPFSTVGDNYYVKTGKRGDFPFGATVGFDKLTVKGSLDIVDSNTDSTEYLQAVGSGKIDPIDGISVAGAFSYNENGKDAHAATVSTLVNIAKIADLDVTLSLSGMGFFYFGDESTMGNKYFVAIQGGIDRVQGAIQYGSVAGVGSMNAKIGYNHSDALWIGGGLYATDISKFGESLGVWGEVDYTISNITTYVSYGYEVEKSKSTITTGLTFTY